MSDSDHHTTNTLFSLLNRVASRYPSNTALEESEERINYENLLKRVNSFCNWLKSIGICRGDHIALHLPKGYDEAIAIISIMYMGGVFVSIAHQQAIEKNIYILKDSNLKLLIADEEFIKQTKNKGCHPEGIKIVAYPNSNPEGDALCWPDFQSFKGPYESDVEENDLATLLYTSGSTGTPKGVMHTQKNILHCAYTVSRYLKKVPEDRTLGLLPFGFGYGLNQIMIAISSGSTLVIQKSNFIADIINTIEKTKITGFAGIPSILNQCYLFLRKMPRKADSLRYLTCAGGKLTYELAKNLKELLPHVDIIPMYGTTETLRSSYLAPKDFDQKNGSIGKAIDGVELFVISEDRTRICDIDEVGELVHVGAHVMEGYWNDPKATAQSLQPCPALKKVIGDRKLFSTGDLARKDKDGFFWFHSRAKWMVKSGGFRYSLTEAEHLIEQSGLVEEVATFAVDHPLKEQAIVVVARPKEKEGSITPALQEYCRLHLPPYMQPIAMHERDRDFPLTHNGKLDRNALISEYSQQP